MYTKIATTTLIIILAIILVALGFWQLRRADEKRQLLVSFKQQFHSTPLPLAQLKKPKLYQAVSLSGKPITRRQLLLDNKFNHHRVGYHVLVPVEIAKDKPWVLVNLGWIAMGPSRQQLPSLKPIASHVNWQGNIYYSKRTPLRLGDSSAKSWPRVIERLNFKEITQQLNHAIYPFVVLLAPNEDNGYVRQWQPTTMPPERHIGYAFQWFALALGLLIAYAVVLRKKKS